MPPSGASNPIYEILATLGLDTRDFERGLKEAQREVREGSLAMVSDIQRLKSALNAIAADTKGKIGQAIFSDVEMQRSSAAITEHGRRIREMTALEQDFARAIKNRDTVLAAAAREEQRITRDAARMDREMARQRSDDLRRIDREFQGAMRARDRGFAAENPPEEAGPGMGFFSRQLMHMGIAAGIYGGARLIGSSMERTLDIQRRSEETGFSPRSVQELEYAAVSANTPIENLSGAIARLQINIENINPRAVGAVRSLGLDFSKLKDSLEKDSEPAVRNLILAIADLESQAKKLEAYRGLFGGRASGETIKGLEEWAKGGAGGVIISNQELATVAKFEAQIKRMFISLEASVAKGLAFMFDESEEPAFARRDASGILQDRRRIGTQLKSLYSTIPVPDIPRVGPIEMPPSMGDVNSKLGDARFQELRAIGERMDQDIRQKIAEEKRLRETTARRILDDATPTGLRNINQLNRDLASVPSLVQGGLLTSKQASAVKGSLQARADEEMAKMREEELTKTVRLLNDFGADGKRNTEMVEDQWRRLTEAFHRGRISLEEFRHAQSNYYDMVDARREGPGIREAMRRFETGNLSEQELLIAREIYKRRQGRGQVEEAFTRGEATPADLLRSQQQYRETLDFFRPRRTAPQFPGITLSPEDHAPFVISGSPQARNMGGTINIVPLDQFSDSILRRWQQQGWSAAG